MSSHPTLNPRAHEIDSIIRIIENFIRLIYISNPSAPPVPYLHEGIIWL